MECFQQCGAGVGDYWMVGYSVRLLCVACIFWTYFMASGGLDSHFSWEPCVDMLGNVDLWLRHPDFSEGHVNDRGRRLIDLVRTFQLPKGDSIILWRLNR